MQEIIFMTLKSGQPSETAKPQKTVVINLTIQESKRPTVKISRHAFAPFMYIRGKILVFSIYVTLTSERKDNTVEMGKDPITGLMRKKTHFQMADQHEKLQLNLTQQLDPYGHPPGEQKSSSSIISVFERLRSNLYLPHAAEDVAGSVLVT